MKINKISLIESKSERISVDLSAEITDEGDLLLSGCDFGELVKERFGDFDYEYWLKVKGEYKDTILLYLIRERFANDAEFKAWLNENRIPNDFWSF